MLRFGACPPVAFTELVAVSRLMQVNAPSAENPPQVTVSIVSHGHGALVTSLLADLATHCGPRIAVILTLNIPEYLTVGDGAYPFQLKLIRNDAPKGFGANHNAAFASVTSPFFCVVNPDVRLKSDLFPALIKVFTGDRVAVAGPLVRAPDGRVEDSARRFPTAYSLLRKSFVKSQGPDYSTDGGQTEVDWVAGMFMLFDSRAFRGVGGFDEDYFLYYEDVDICRRLGALRRSVVCVPEVEIIHEARRASRHNLRHAWWHAKSIFRFLRSCRELGRRGMR
jgi:GT2 family glycosyltransferase